MVVDRRARFRRLDRLRSASEFRRVFKRGRRLDGRFFTLIVLPREEGEDRLGLAVSRRVGGAVVRNRAKRLLRETFRRQGRSGGPGYDLVFLLKTDICRAGQEDVDREYEGRLRRIKSPNSKRGSTRPPGRN